MTVQVEYYALLCWILKDASWVLLVPYTAWLSLAGALTFETWFVVSSFQERDEAGYATQVLIRSGQLGAEKGADMYQKLNRLVPLVWICGNGVWMTAELLYEKPSPSIHFPWLSAPLIAEMDKPDLGSKAVAGLLFAVAFWICAAAQVLGRWKPAGARTLSELDQDAWIGFWALKDLCWVSNWPWLALLCSALVCALLLRSRSLQRDDWKGDSIHLAELIWLSANTVWLIAELLLADKYPYMRVLVFGILLVALGFNIQGFSRTR